MPNNPLIKKRELLQILDNIKGSGTFATTGTMPGIIPGLTIDGFGEIAFPIQANQLKKIMNKVGASAPFGQGSQTVRDDKVRSAWQIDCDLISFANESWSEYLDHLINEVEIGLGLEGEAIEAKLHKMLIYQKGDFFKAHKDSEKAPGMFGSLVIGLPALHKGGQLIVRFDGQEEIIDFTNAVKEYQFPFAAFYADCDHEIRPVTSGFRVCLTYNLIRQKKRKSNIGLQTTSRREAEMSKILKELESEVDGWPLAYLLNHQYTPTNFSLGQLKHNDQARAQALMRAADQAGYYSKLALVTYYQLGELEGADVYYSRWSRRYQSDVSAGIMGEIYEEYFEVRHWNTAGAPGLGAISIPEDQLFASIRIGDGSPIAQEEQGYTGNEGMTMEYWYHYGAVVLWPRRVHMNILEHVDFEARLQWADHYAQMVRRQNSSALKKDLTKILLSFENDINSTNSHVSMDLSPLADILATLQDQTFLKQQGFKLLSTAFTQIEPNCWINLISQTPKEAMANFLEGIMASQNIDKFHHSLCILKVLQDTNENALLRFSKKICRKIPVLLENIYLPFEDSDESDYFYKDRQKEHQSTIRGIMKTSFLLNDNLQMPAVWQKELIEKFSETLSRQYIHNVLKPVLFDNDSKRGRTLKVSIAQRVLKHLIIQTRSKPQAPSDWSRAVRSTKKNKAVWKIIRPFLESATSQIYDYKANKSLRREMERAIRSVKVDVSTRTLKQGVPHTLRLTKNQATYECLLQEWKQDLALIKKLQKMLN